ncbi:sialidase family protein [Candidatus Methylospira mobilis]|uniref:sialidase family protein n=1 Tax=Candidatus Methylospira mobilis TaxID=1808979 RepID=UPI0028E9772B|nr:sialidase family protein [Candidatus Methylospira mobilis]WNV05330.1 sialidase family protein [Candidatus Methylospira mobilis]
MKLTDFSLESALFALAGIALLAVNATPQPEPPQFELPAATSAQPTAPDAAAFIQTHRLTAPAASAHSATLVRLGDGTMLAFWFAGSREGAGDVAIWYARNSAQTGQWSSPEQLTTPGQTARDELRYIKKLGNPVAVVDRQGTINLYYVSVSLGGWSLSSLNRMQSQDGGFHWQPAKKLVTSPFLNISTLVRTQAAPLSDGGYLLPVYHELARKNSELLQFDAGNRLLRKIRMNTAGENLQPALEAINPVSAFALLRNSAAGQLLYQETHDGGLRWSQPETLEVPNPDASVALTRLADGRFLLALNPTSQGRGQLALAVSTDGRHWKTLRVLENESSGEFSYPCLVTQHNITDLVYTWQRKEIRHLRFNTAWLDEGVK